MLRITRLMLIIVCLWLFSGCVSLTSNHYQDAKTMGKKKAVGGASIALVNGYAGLPEIDSTGYVFDEDEVTSYPSANVGVFAIMGVSDYVDIGTALTTSLGSSEIKLFSKYRISKHDEPLQLAVMGAVGLGRGRVSTSSSNVIDSSETNVSHRLLSIEVPLLITYRLSSYDSFTLSPKLFYQSMKSERTEMFNGVEQSNFSGTYSTLAPAIGLGFKTQALAGEFTYMFRKDLNTDDYVGVYELGVAYYGWRGLLKLLLKFF